MDKSYSFKRWYDVKPYTDEVLEILKGLSLQSHYDIAREVLKIIEAIKLNSRELDDPPLSLGVDRVLGLFNQNHKRRWYDKNLPVARIFKSASCLQDDDFQNIMQGIFVSLSEESTNSTQEAFAQNQQNTDTENDFEDKQEISA